LAARRRGCRLAVTGVNSVDASLLANARCERPVYGRFCLRVWAFAVSSYVEVWGRGGRALRALDSERMTVGTLESNDVVVDADGVSRVHAVFERFGDAWCVRDLGSRNGTFVNGGRIIGGRALHSGDEIVLGRVRLLFHGPPGGKETAAIAQAPPLTPRERDVLLALCRPLLMGDTFTEPASIRAIAAELVVSEAAVKQHLSRLYSKFDVDGRAERKRVQLANAAVSTGAVKLSDLRPRA
jgi:FHA domain